MSTYVQPDATTVLPNRRQRRHPEPRLAYSPEEAAEALGVSRSTIYSMMRANALRTAKAGSRRLVPAAELDRLLGDLHDER
jgi:excisionase family DNA binding protein